MNKQQAKMEQMVALTLLAYVIAMFFGEALRDISYGSKKLEELSLETFLVPSQPGEKSKWKLYSGLFILLRQKPRVPTYLIRQLNGPVSRASSCLILGNVRTYV